MSGLMLYDTARAALAEALRVAVDLGHPLGTVQSWTHRLGLTNPSKNPIHGAAE